MEQTPTSNANNTATTTKKPELANKGLIIGLTICAITAIGGIAFGICEAINANNKSSEISDLQTQIIAKDETIAALSSETTTVPSDNPPTVTEPASSYSAFADNLAKNVRGKFFSGYYYHYNGSENVQRFATAEVDDNNHLKVVDYDGKTVIAEADDIISVYFVRLGNGGVPYFYIINKNGKIARINISEYDRTNTVESSNEYSNIVSIFNTGDLYVWVIDIDGNLYKTPMSL